MPYTGPGDPKLPDNVKRLPAKQKRQWIEVFNDAYARCKAGKLKPPKGGLKKGYTCERRAFAIAYGVVKGAKSMDEYEEAEAEGQKEAEEQELQEQECTHAEGEKCDSCGAVPVDVMPLALGGATSFAEVDEYRKAREQDAKIHDQEYDFRTVFDNIMMQPNEEMTLAQKALAVRKAASDLANRVKAVATGQKGLLARAKAFVFGSKDERNSVFYAFKDLDDTWRWLALATNKFVDKEGEVFPEEAHKEYVQHVDATGDYPELRVEHVLGSGIGRADFVEYADGFRIDSGTFYDGFEDVAEKLADSDEPLGISHGFRYKLMDKVAGVFRRYRSFEDSIVPFERAANPWTEWTMERVKEVLGMPMSKEKRARLVGIIGEERTAVIEQRLPAAEKALEEAGIGWKEVAEIGEALEGETPAAAPAPAPAGEPAPAAAPAPAPAATPGAEGKPPEEPGGESAEALTQQVAEGVKALAAGQEKLAETVTTLAGEVELLKRTDDEKIAAKVAPKAAKVLGDQPRPSTDPATALPNQEAVKEDLNPEPSESPSKPYVDDLLRTGAVGVMNLPTAAPAGPPAAPPDGGGEAGE